MPPGIATQPLSFLKMAWIHNNWLAIAVVVALVFSFVVQHDDATSQATKNERDSIARSVATCNRQQPGRAYLQIRAAADPSGPAKDATAVYAILDCDATVANNGVPVALRASEEAKYLTLFKRRRIGIVKDGRVTGSVSCDEALGRPCMAR